MRAAERGLRNLGAIVDDVSALDCEVVRSLRVVSVVTGLLMAAVSWLGWVGLEHSIWEIMVFLVLGSATSVFAGLFGRGLTAAVSIGVTAAALGAFWSLTNSLGINGIGGRSHLVVIFLLCIGLLSAVGWQVAPPLRPPGRDRAILVTIATTQLLWGAWALERVASSLILATVLMLAYAALTRRYSREAVVVRSGTIDTSAREAAASLLLRFEQNSLTGDELERDWPRSDDVALESVAQVIWYLYDDDVGDGRFEGSAEGRELLVRCRRFFLSSCPYEWPVPNRWLVIASLPLSLITFGLANRFLWRRYDFPKYWPFSSQSQLDHARHG